MPSKSKKQARMMTAVCKSPSFRQKVGISKKVGCDFHKADKGKYHEEINIDERMSHQHALELVSIAKTRNQSVPQSALDALNYYKKDRNGVNEMSDKQLDEKLRFGKAKEEISTDGAPDIGRLMKMAGIQKQLDDDRENGKLDIRGILTGVAKGDIDISEADARLQELAGMDQSGNVSEVEQDKLSLIQEIEQQIKERDTHLVEDEDEEVDEAKDEEIDEKKEWVKPWEKDKEGDEDKEEVDESYWWNKGSNETERLRQLAGLKAKTFTEAVRDEEVDEAKDEEVDEDKKEDLDEDSESYLAARDKAIKKAMGKDTDEDSDADEDKEESDEDKKEIDEAIERKYFRELDTFKQGSLSRYMAEMIVDEMKKGKTNEEISEELSFDIDEVSYIAEFARERATEAKTVGGKWGIERASDKEDKLIARLDKKDTGDARIAKPKPRKRDKYDDMARKHGLEDDDQSTKDYLDKGGKITKVRSGKARGTSMWKPGKKGSGHLTKQGWDGNKKNPHMKADQVFK